MFPWQKQGERWREIRCTVLGIRRTWFFIPNSEGHGSIRKMGTSMSIDKEINAYTTVSEKDEKNDVEHLVTQENATSSEIKFKF